MPIYVFENDLGERIEEKRSMVDASKPAPKGYRRVYDNIQYVGFDRIARQAESDGMEMYKRWEQNNPGKDLTKEIGFTQSQIRQAAAQATKNKLKKIKANK